MSFESIIYLDQQASLAINSLHCPASDALWSFFSSITAWIPFYAILVGCLVWRLGWKRALIFTIAIAMMILCCDQLANLVKNSVCRLRPCHDPSMIAAGIWAPKSGGLYGFYSGHAANTFALAWAVVIAFRSDIRLRYRGLAALMFTWSSLVAISRVFLAMHYLGDITIGAIMGSILGIGFALAARLFCNKRLPVERQKV